MKWNEFDTNIKEYLRIIREDQRLFDVTLVTDDGQHIQAHKIILSAGSQFFGDIFLKSNQANMLIYLKGINNVQLKHLLDFIYNGETSVGQEEVNEFLETGKELQVKGFEAYQSSMGESLEKDQEIYSNEKDDKCENTDNITTEENIICDSLKPSSEQHSSTEFAFQEYNERKIQTNVNSDLDLQILEMIEKSDDVWKCKVCGKTSNYKKDMRDHAESHILGISHTCNICNKSFSNRPSLRPHINHIHNGQLTCDLCGKSGMNKSTYYHHKRTQHKILPGTL